MSDTLKKWLTALGLDTALFSLLIAGFSYHNTTAENLGLFLMWKQPPFTT